MAKLVCQTGPKAGHEYPLTKDVTIMGRQSSSDVQILDNMSSRAHCQIRRDGKLFSLVDLGSRNGTYLNNKKVAERQLSFGDTIRIGEAEYKFIKEPGDVELKDLLSKYEVMEKIGEGGMGIVYKANQKSMNRIVALKILSPKYSSRQRFVDQFIKEARAAGALNHPNIIQVHDVGTENDIHYFSMEYVEGPTCMQELRSHGPFTAANALEITRQTAKALEYAHSQRLIHQDIKPDNIMIGQNNQVKLADLGISKTFDEVESEEGPKRVMGTPHYMAPEAALGKKIDHRVDIYSLGATLYHLLTGKTPYSGTSATEVLKAHVMDPLPAIHDINPDVPEEVCALVERLVAKKAEDRYQSAADVVAEVTRLQQGKGLSAERIGGGETMLLRRYVSGDKSPAAGNPTHTTNTRTPRATEGGATTAERSVRGDNGNPLLIRAGVIFTIVLILFLVGYSILSRGGTTPITPQPPSPENPTPGTEAQPKPTPQNAEDRAHANALTGLEDRLRRNAEALNLDAMRSQVEELRNQRLSKENLERARLLLDRIADIQKQQHVKSVEQSYSTLDNEVQKLVNEYNFELAKQRIAAFPSKDDPAVASKVALLSEEINRKQTNYLSTLKLKVQGAVSQKNLTKLTELRNALPQALLGTDAEKSINDAIAQLEGEKLAKLQVLAKQCGEELSRWNLAAVDDIAIRNASDLQGTEAGREVEKYRTAATHLKEMTQTLGVALRSAAKPPRYRGILNGFNDPDLLDTDNSGLQIELETGARATIKWSELKPDALITVVGISLSKEEADKYQSALSILSALSPAP